ncbi:MAG TPA: sensor histidine kinase [Anaerolineales bacterium]|nr:sensor histidine kinase [Anaerolineales bacterium]
MSYYLAYLIYLAVIARGVGWNYETAPISTTVWILLAIYGAFLFSARVLTKQFPSYSRFYILVQSVLTIAMFYLSPTLDFLGMLLLPLCFQAVQFFHAPFGFVWIGVLILALSGMMIISSDWQAGLTSIVTGAGTGFLMGSFAYLMTRTEQKRQENQHLLGDLQQAYRQLKDSAAQAEELAAATERHRLVRELHDSLTQTLFSMNLAVQSAQFSIYEDPPMAEEQLIRLQNLTRNAASEVQALLGRSPHGSLAQGGLATALQQLASERLEQDGLQVTIEATGERELPEFVNENLYRIAQEALNNITRHAGVRQALIRLCLDSPLASLEIMDEGSGFDPVGAQHAGGIGLAGMAERAREMGWKLEVKSHPGYGTRVCIEEKQP